MEVCGKNKYIEDVEIFLRFLKFTKVIARGNGLLYSSTESKRQIYNFIADHFESMHKHDSVFLRLTS